MAKFNAVGLKKLLNASENTLSQREEVTTIFNKSFSEYIIKLLKK